MPIGERVDARGGALQAAIDLGTSNAITAVRAPNGWVGPVPFDGSPYLPAAVFATETGQLLVGRDAEHGALRAPARYEPHPKRRIDEGRVLLGDREYDVAWLLSAVLHRAYSEACRFVRAQIPSVVLPYPVDWGQRRRSVLAAAAAAARLPGVRLVPEPVAAAAYFVHAQGVPVPTGAPVLVYDLGGGTFEATALRRTAGGFEVLATEGLADVGGNDIDAAISAHLRKQVRPDDGAWRQLTQPGSSLELHATRQLWDGVRAAKERLSRTSSAVVSVPLLGVDVPLGREQFEDLARPILERTVAVTESVLAAARLAPGQLAAVFPVDGSSRIPLVATLLHRALGVAPASIEDPSLAVALGCLAGRRAAPGTPPPPPGALPPPGAGPTPTSSPPYGPAAPTSAPPTSGPPVPVPPMPVPPMPVPPMPVPPRPGQPLRPGVPQPGQPQPGQPMPRPAVPRPGWPPNGQPRPYGHP